MNTIVIEQGLDLWEAWIEFNNADEGFGTLYVLGEPSESISYHRLQLVKSAEINSPRVLELEVKAMPQARRRSEKECMFAETINSIDTYHTVRVRFGNEILAEMNDLEVLI